jgi:hypothetical protein
MKVGDVVKHKYGTLMGCGVILSMRRVDGGRARIAWTAHGQTKIHDVATLHLEVVNESR